MDYASSEYDEEPFDKVFAWFIEPIRKLKESRGENSDGAFLAMSASLAMYERYLIKVAQSQGQNDEDARAKLGGSDLGIGEAEFRLFWSCFRDGLQHQFQPTKKRNGKTYYWSISDDHGEIPAVVDNGDKTINIKINPWTFAELVHSRYIKNPEIFEKGKSHKPGEVQSLEVDQQHDSETPLAGFHTLPLNPPTLWHNSPTQDPQKTTMVTGVFPSKRE